MRVTVSGPGPVVGNVRPDSPETGGIPAIGGLQREPASGQGAGRL
jgi:hypothetical protein